MNSNIYVCHLIKCLIICHFISSCSSKDRIDRLITEGNSIIVKIDSFKIINKTLPKSLKDIGIQENIQGPIYYEIRDDNFYELSFGLELGESVVFNSKTRIWYIPAQ